MKNKFGTFMIVFFFIAIVGWYVAALYGSAPLIITAGRDRNLNSVIANACLFALVLTVFGSVISLSEQEKEK